MTETLYNATITLCPALAEGIRQDINWPESSGPEPDAITLFEDEEQNIWTLTLWVTVKPDTARQKEIEKALGQILGEMPPVLPFKRVQQKDWVKESQKHLRPVEAGKFFIYGSHDRDKQPSGKICLEIEAANAFGTGHHETTAGMLKAISLLADEINPQKIMDLGCGSAVLAMAASRIWPNAYIIASDIDGPSITVAQENIQKNKCPLVPAGDTRPGITTLHANGLNNPYIQSTAPYDLILANILAGPLTDMAADIGNFMKKGGTVLLAGLLENQEADIIKTYEKVGFKHLRSRLEGKWPTIWLQKI